MGRKRIRAEVCGHTHSGWIQCVLRRREQQERGDDYDTVQPVYLIGLMGVPIDHPDKEFWKDRYVSEYTFREKDCHDLLGETIVIIFAELASFDKSEEECVTRQDRMLYILKNSSKLLTPPAWSGQERYTEILDACYIDHFDQEKRKNTITICTTREDAEAK